jgi:hypothetical protein
MIRVDDFSHDGRYRRFAAEALRLGINSSLSFPLIVNDASIGALNIYGQDVKGFDRDSEQLGAASAAKPRRRSRTPRSITARSRW